jgi:hypothetical protein
MAYSYVQYNGNGSTTAFSIPFPYIDKAHVSVTLDGVLFAGFTFLSASSISVSPAPAAGVLVEVRRVTPKTSRMVDYQDAAVLTAAALDLNADQSMYIVQEAHDLAGDFNASGNIIRDEAVAAAEEAAASAASILGAVVDAGAEADAAAQSASEAATSAANAATSETNAATSANTATTKAGEAVTSASNAASSASGASTSATTASTQATNAATSATTATTQAGNAATSATTATTKADEASASATAASGSASTASSAATTATTKAAEASTSATNAATSASTAASAVSTHAAVTATHGATGAVVGTTNVQTLTNKTLTAPKLSTEVVDVVVNNRPSTRPSLNLDFANSKVLDPRITFTRASTATYYDGKTVAKAEENLLPFSEQFDNAAWLKSNSTVTANTTVAPDGTTTADTVTLTSGGTNSNVGQTTNILADTYVFSCFVKAGTASVVQVGFLQQGIGLFFVSVDLSTGTFGTPPAGLNALSIVDAGNGWFRVAVSRTFTAAASNHIPRVAGGSETTAGQDFHVWGAQLEQRASVTAYTPTTTAPITKFLPVLMTAAANVARFDHDPVTGESKGLLIEEARTNLLTYSEQFDAGAWIKTRATITPNILIAPDGSLSADKLVEDSTASSSHFIEFQRAGSIGNFALSCYCKAGERSIVRVALFSTNINSHATFDLSTGTASSPDSVLDYSITPVGNGWYRCFISANQPDSRTLQVRILLVDSGTNITYTGDGTSGIYIWGAQLEAGYFPTSYIKTEASTVTRNADVAVMTGTNFSDWYRADEGTLFATHSRPFLDASRASHIVNASDGSLSNSVALYLSAISAAQVDITTGSTSQANIATAGVLVTGLAYNHAAAFAKDSVALSVNASTPAVDSFASIPSALTRMDIGGRWDGQRTINGHIKRIAYYPKRLSNAELQAITQE